MLRPLIGNRVYGCDDCRLICLWNKFAANTGEEDFAVRNGLDDTSLLELFGWTKEELDTRLADGSISRIRREQWLRNLALGLGNAPVFREGDECVARTPDDVSSLVRAHVRWALHRMKRVFSP